MGEGGSMPVRACVCVRVCGECVGGGRAERTRSGYDSMCVRAYLCVCVCTRVPVCVRARARTCVCVCARACVRMCVDVCVYIRKRENIENTRGGGDEEGRTQWCRINLTENKLCPRRKETPAPLSAMTVTNE